MTLKDGVIFALGALVFSVYLGFIFRLIYERIHSVELIIRSLLEFTFLLIYHAIMPLIAFLIVVFDKEIRSVKRIRTYVFLLMYSPFIGIKYTVTKLPVNYNKLVRYIKNQSDMTDSSIKEFNDPRTMFSILNDKINSMIKTM